MLLISLHINMGLNVLTIVLASTLQIVGEFIIVNDEYLLVLIIIKN